MEKIRLGRTGLLVTKTAFGALPIQRISKADAVKLVRRAYEAGITSGASSTGFAPDSALTREQAVTLLCNYAEAQGLDVSAAADLSGYPDASAVSAFAQDAVAWAVDAGLLTGTGAGTLNPQGTATRAELAALLVRAEALFTAE